MRSLNNYLLVGAVWTAGSTAVMVGEHGWDGLLPPLLANLGFMSGIWLLYQQSFQRARDRHNLTPNIIPKSASTSSAETQKAVSVIYA